MYNQSALIRISKQLFPDKNVFQLTKQEQSQVLSIYNEFHYDIYFKYTLQKRH